MPRRPLSPRPFLWKVLSHELEFDRKMRIHTTLFLPWNVEMINKAEIINKALTNINFECTICNTYPLKSVQTLWCLQKRPRSGTIWDKQMFNKNNRDERILRVCIIWTHTENSFLSLRSRHALFAMFLHNAWELYFYQTSQAKLASQGPHEGRVSCNRHWQRDPVLGLWDQNVTVVNSVKAHEETTRLWN